MSKTARLLLAMTVGLGSSAGCRPQGATTDHAVRGHGRKASTFAREALKPSRSEAHSVERFTWRHHTRSPQATLARTPREESIAESCPHADGALDRVAQRIGRRRAAGLPSFDTTTLSFALRAEGAPYVWPRVWTLADRGLATSQVASEFGAFVSHEERDGEARCGIASTTMSDGTEIVTAVVVHAWADLQPLGTVARLGQWLRLEASLSPEARDAKWIALGPLGPPRPLPTTVSAEHARAVVSVDQSGEWLMQLLVTTTAGPQPVLEASVFVDRAPPTTFDPSTAPGEDAARSDTPPELALLDMVNGARAVEGHAPLSLEPTLQQIAQEHADGMRRRHLLAHDVGQGDPYHRTLRAGLPLRLVGENVAHARTIRRAHRVIWASPSHRQNVLFPRYDSIGTGVAEESDGSVWVCELFANFAGAGIADEQENRLVP